ncbi:MAG TPA: YhcH/YjgK/YiaL family protein [Candidatus Gastranaerophilales bacterium]|nr:YhcH/YjgK/YiaL family protein [Candidatus Gastranaerophilales bacterium]
MIIDKLENASFYFELNNKIKTGLQYLAKTDLLNLENGRYEIDGDKIFVVIQEYSTKSQDQSLWEAHRNYIDIQYIIKGQEKIGYLNINKFFPSTEYNKEKDIVFGDGEGEFLTATTGDFIIFTPHDAHKPGICLHEPDYVKKAVVKIYRSCK